jgi:RNA polymerase sigma-70 factor (ECF subfamily)
MLGDRSLAEDTTQDIFVKVHRELPQFDAQRGTFTAWLVVIARNVCIDAQRKQRLRAFLSHHLSPAHEQTIAAAASDPLDYVIGLEEHERFQQALTRLSPSLRAVVDHVIVQRQSYSDAAAALGCTTGAIGASLSKAKEKLKRYLKETT